ncbi:MULTISPECIES: hypothetical protein [Micromonospora]|uniref:hypothetical protein n=1 Tax=Micromonospora TaxID=1873 RepID=UPI00161B2773|nr:hypothetical protein [Micromonospora aurantiaca]MCT2280912.1 hypothetical protein [Micromonospora chalcea]
MPDATAERESTATQIRCPIRRRSGRPTPKKRKESKFGKQYVANTGPAKRARRNATSAEQLSELPVAEAAKLVRDLDKAQLKSALRRDRDGKSRKTLIQQLKKELDRR